MKIGHAVSNENGTARGGIAGDQTGREIRTQKWYNRDGGWYQYIEPIDADLGDKAATWMERICADDRFGYSQDQRRTGYDEIRNNGFDEAGNSCFDCSSLCAACYALAEPELGLNPGGISTRNIGAKLEKTGRFRLYTDTEHLTDPELAVRGGMWCTPGKHVCMALEDGAASVVSVGANAASVGTSVVSVGTSAPMGDLVTVTTDGSDDEYAPEETLAGTYPAVNIVKVWEENGVKYAEVEVP